MALLGARAPCTWIATSTARCAVSVAKSFAIADARAPGRTPASYWAAASSTSRRAGLDLRRHLGELVRHRLEAGRRLSERLPLGRIGNGRVERRLGHTDAEGADARPEEVERVHRDREAAADLAEQLLGTGADPVEVEAADRVRRDQLEVLAREAVGVARDGEGGDPLRARRRCARRRSRRPLRGFEIQSFVPVRPEPRRRPVRLELSAAASEPASGSLSAKAAATSPERGAAAIVADAGCAAGGSDSRRALQRERGLGLGTAVRQSLPQLGRARPRLPAKTSSSSPSSPSALTSRRFSRPGSPWHSAIGAKTS